MLKSLISLLIVCVGGIAMAAGSSSGSGKGERWMVNGFYGLGFVSPGDINGIASALGTTPKLNSITSSTYFGGSVGFAPAPRIQIRGSYELENAKNPTTTTSPAITNGGFEINQYDAWLGGNYRFVQKGEFYVYGGAEVGYPTYSHLTATLSTKTEYDADKTIGYRGIVGCGFLFGQHFSVFVEGRYTYMVSGDVKNSSGALTVSNGSKAKIDMSGARVQGGIAVYF